MITTKKLSPYILLAFAILLLGACRSGPFSKLPMELEEVVRTYEGVVRWGGLQKMYAFLKHDPANPVKIQEGLGNIRVTGYDALSPLTEISEFRYRQSVMIDYVLIDRQVMRQVLDEQIWFSEDEGKTWYREPPLPVFQ